MIDILRHLLGKKLSEEVMENPLVFDEDGEVETLQTKIKVLETKLKVSNEEKKIYEEKLDTTFKELIRSQNRVDALLRQLSEYQGGKTHLS